MKIVVSFAVGPEFAPWRRLRYFRRGLAEGIPVHEACIGDAEVRVVLTGVGLRNAERVMRTVLSDGAGVCISSGLAGGLKGEHHLGEILVARAVRSSRGNHFLRSDARLLQLAVRAGAKLVDLVYSSESVVVTPRDKYRLGMFADAVEMESFAILSAAAAWGVPAIVVRAISDPVSVELPYDLSQALNKRGQVSIPRVLSQIAKAPQRLPALMRLGRESRRAAVQLARFLDQYVESCASEVKRCAELQQVAAG